MALPFIFVAALFGGSVFYQHRQAKKAQAKARQQEAQARAESQAAFHRSMQVQVQDYPRTMVFGTTNRIGGNLIWMHKSPAGPYHMVAAMCVNPLSAVPLVYVDDEVLFEGSTEVIPWWIHLTPKAGTRYGNNIQTYIVNSTSLAKPDLATAIFPNGGGYPDPAVWTSNHWRAKDFTFAVVAFSADPELFSGPPNLTFVVRPRATVADHSALGDLGNPVSALYEYMGSKHGWNKLNRLDRDSFVAAANSWVIPGLYPAPGKLKSETVYIADLTKNHNEHVAALLDACNGRLTISKGKFKVQVNYRSTFVMSLTEDGFCGRFKVNPTLPGRDRFNAVNVSYINKDKLWAADNYLHVLDGVAPEAQVVKDISLPLSTADGCAQVASQLVREQLNQMTIECDYDIRAMQLEAGNIVRVTNAKYGFSEKEFEVEQMRFESESGEVKFRLNLQEYDPDVYNDAAAPDSLADGPETNLPNRNFVPTPTSFSVSEELYRIGDVVSNKVVASWVADSYFTSQYELQYRPTGSNWPWTTGRITKELNAEFDLDVSESANYDFRVSGINSFGYRSAFAYFLNHPILGKTALPQAPTNPKITVNGDKIRLSFVPPADLDLMDYKVLAVPLQNGGSQPPVQDFIVGSSSFDFPFRPDGFDGNTQYGWEFQVQSRDTGRRLSFLAMRARAQKTRPVKPTGISVVASNSSFHADWPDSQDFALVDFFDGDPYERVFSLDVKKYEVQVLRESDSIYRLIRTRRIDTSFYREENVLPGNYKIRVRSEDDSGDFSTDWAESFFVIADVSGNLTQTDTFYRTIFSSIPWGGYFARKYSVGLGNCSYTSLSGASGTNVGPLPNVNFGEQPIAAEIITQNPINIYPCLRFQSFVIDGKPFRTFASQKEVFKSIMGRYPENFAEMGTTFIDPLNQAMTSTAVVWFPVTQINRNSVFRADLTAEWKSKIKNLNYSFEIRAYSSESWEAEVGRAMSAELIASNAAWIRVQLFLDARSVVDSGNVFFNSLASETNAISLTVHRIAFEERALVSCSAADSGGTVINLQNNFLAINSVEYHPKGNSFTSMIVDWSAATDTITAFAFDEDGVRKDANFLYIVRGY